MRIACAFLYRDDPGYVAIVDMDMLKSTGAGCKIANKITAEMAKCRTHQMQHIRDDAAKNSYGIELPYDDCQSDEVMKAFIDPPCEVDVVVTIYVSE